jgi:7-cyano-7-deazaguanine reductase
MQEHTKNQQASDELRNLASKHLGKAGDGSLVKPYITPEKHDKTLLVPLPRSINRAKSNIKETDFEGFEIWHAYEMSFLYQNGMPCTGILRAYFPFDSANMVESKSFKLYLNSFDLEKFNSLQEVENIIKQDLTEAAGGEVQVNIHEANSCIFKPLKFHDRFQNVDSLGIEITTYKEDDSFLDVSETSNGTLLFHTSNLRSNCEITNQKDTGNSYIYIKGNTTPTLEGLTKYVISFRDTQHFHENATEILYSTLKEKYSPDELFVGNIYNRRGGLDIHSFRASSKAVITEIIGQYGDTEQLFSKTSQQ